MWNLFSVCVWMTRCLFLITTTCWWQCLVMSAASFISLPLVDPAPQGRIPTGCFWRSWPFSAFQINQNKSKIINYLPPPPLLPSPSFFTFFFLLPSSSFFFLLLLLALFQCILYIWWLVSRSCHWITPNHLWFGTIQFELMYSQINPWKKYVCLTVPSNTSLLRFLLWEC